MRIPILSALFGRAHRKMAREIFAFQDATFIENLAIRTNGHILLNTFSSGDVYSLDPTAASPKPVVAASLPGATGLTGIAPIGPDVYAISGGVHLPFSFLEGTMRVYTVDFLAPASPGDQGLGSGNTVTVTSSTHVPNTQMLNGMAALPGKPFVVLSGDSIGGRMFRIDTQTGGVDVAFTDPWLEPGDGAKVPLGVNGVKIFEDRLYFTNSAKGVLARVKIDGDGNKVGDVEVLARLPGGGGEDGWSAYDDLAIDSKGTAYVAMHGNAVMKITRGGKQTVLAGGGSDTFLKEPTSVALTEDEKTIYVSTGGKKIGDKEYGGQIAKVSV